MNLCGFSANLLLLELILKIVIIIYRVNNIIPVQAIMQYPVVLKEKRNDAEEFIDRIRPDDFWPARSLWHVGNGYERAGSDQRAHSDRSIGANQRPGVNQHACSHSDRRT